MKAYLTEETGPNIGKDFPLKKGKNVIGRHPDCRVHLEVGAVSRNHAQVIVENNNFYLEDLNSRNGTYLNNDLVRGRQPLKDGDRLSICDVVFTFKSGSLRDGFAHSSGFSTVLFDDQGDGGNSSIMSKLDVSSSISGIQLSASPEAKLAALLEITQNLGRALSLDEVLPQVLQSLFKIFVQADRGFIVLRNDDGTLVPRWTELRRKSDQENLRVSRTIVTQVMKAKEAILSKDAASDTRFEMSQSIADFKIRSMMCAPLLDSDGEAFGVLQIDTVDQRNRFQPEDLELLASVATQAAIAITNAQLHEQALRQRSVERDLELAHEVQKGFLPENPPKIDGYAFYDYYEPADQVGGDYFDYIELPDGRFAVIVADVVGHGIAAAMMMVKFSSEARVSLVSCPEPREAVTMLNDRLSTLPTDRFVTMIMAVIDPTSHEVTIVNAGHMPPMIRRTGGEIEEPGGEFAGLPLGVMEGMEYEQCKVSLEPDELLLLYTDGVNEAMNDQNELYGYDRIRHQIQEAGASSKEIGSKIIEDVRRFMGDAEQKDDMCLACVGRTSS